MLTLLRKNIRRGLKRHILITDDGSKEDGWKHNDSVMVGIEGAMDRLSRLALIIRSSNKTSNFQSVLKHSRSRGPDGFDDLIMALVRWRFGPTEANNCQAQFGMPESLQLQLASSIIYRRNRLVYEFRRQRKFEADRDREDVSETTLSELPEDHDQRAALEAMMMKAPETDRASQKMPEMVSDALNTRSSQPKSLLQTVLTKGMARAPPGDDTTSYASTNRSTNPFIDAKYLKAPTLLPGHSSVGFGETTCASTIRIGPDIFIVNIGGNVLSARRRLLFDSEQLLLQHLEHQHRSEAPLAQLGIIASRGKTHVPLNPDTCPFCGENITLESSENSQSSVPSGIDTGNNNTSATSVAGSNTGQATSFATSLGDSRGPLRTLGNPPVEHKTGALSIKMWKHIADHLESMALWSLRWWAEDSGISQEIEEEDEEDSCNPEVKMSQDALSDDDSRGFEDRIFDSFEASQFPHPGEEFLPANMIDILVTKDVLLGMFPDILDTADGAILAPYILGTSKRLFAITALHCGFNPNILLVCMTNFKRAGFDDEQLPIPDPRSNSQTIHEVFTSSTAGQWGRARLGIFYRFQWRYLSPVFSPEQFQYTFEPSQIMPFTSVSQISRGSFGRVVKAGIHRAHWTAAVINYWKKIGNPELSGELVLQVIIQLQGLADALCQLHKSNKIHGHLKPENIMRSQGPSSVGTLMLGDFGFANRNERGPRLTGDTSKRMKEERMEVGRLRKNLEMD
ncbi:hypothetical protein CKAH01_13940 [Colletotrichum kahawae]|uniref:Protein kinase domain-containing protein n=1 Tax=Colletotrichum kahawae TaxID=34407 RepID=A0AAD9YMH5_COLKA|nr:hypothetical protein CKAH01_13940 [Colletotrichum kahawae]